MEGKQLVEFLEALAPFTALLEIEIQKCQEKEQALKELHSGAMELIDIASEEISEMVRERRSERLG